MKKFINIFNIYIFVTVIIISIFSYIYYFSLNHIINLWTYSEIHLNYSTGFIKRGFLGEIMITLENFGILKKNFFSTIFFLFSITNVFFFTLIIKKITNNIWLFLIFSINPSLILFSFYDLGGYARFEIFGIFIIFLHTLYIQNFLEKKIELKKYLTFYFFIIIPLLFISILIHEINIFTSLFHLVAVLLILKIHNIKFKSYFFFLLPWLFILFLIYFYLTDKVSEERILLIFSNLKDKANVYTWVWTSIFRIGSDAFSEFNYMTNPLSNVFYYLFIFFFYITPIFIIFQSNIKLNMLIPSCVICIPLFFLFILGRDWGRWIHLIIMLFFCFNCAFMKNKLKLDFFSEYNNTSKIILILIIVFQLSMTRIPHCCNLIEKKINLLGGLPNKIIVFYKLTNNKFNINERFKHF